MHAKPWDDFLRFLFTYLFIFSVMFSVKEKLCKDVPDPSNSSLSHWAPKTTLEVNQVFSANHNKTNNQLILLSCIVWVAKAWHLFCLFYGAYRYSKGQTLLYQSVAANTVKQITGVK